MADAPNLYPRTTAERARQLGAKLACDAFNAVGSLDARKCQQLGDSFGAQIEALAIRAAREER